MKTVYDEEPVFLTPEGLKRLISERERLDKIERPQAVQDVYEARQKGDLSENAEYQEARARLSRLQSRIFNIGEKLKRVVPIEKIAAGRIGIGSSVVLSHGNKTKRYKIVSSHEADILRGRLSYLSPLGAAMLNRKKGDVVTIKANEKVQEYTIMEVR